jgi:hypothetical protein
MFTTGTKFFYAVSVVALFAAAVHGFGTGGGLSGVLSFGLLGGVGDASGYVVLVFIAAVTAVLGTALALFRDGDPEVQATVARLDAPPPAVPAAGPAFWPVLGAFAAVLVVLGVVISPVLFVIGGLVGLFVALEWTVQVWSDRASGDPQVNREIRNRLMYPIEIPVAGAAVVGIVIFAVSRMFLALPSLASSLTAVVVAAIVLGSAFLVAYRPTLSRDAVAGLVVVTALAIVGGGVAAAVVGEREFEVHAEEHEGGEGGEAEGAEHEGEVESGEAGGDDAEVEAEADVDSGETGNETGGETGGEDEAGDEAEEGLGAPGPVAGDPSGLAL